MLFQQILTTMLTLSICIIVLFSIKDIQMKWENNLTHADNSNIGLLKDVINIRVGNIYK